ncbi:MAG: hypothetical protein ACR2PT_19945 [Endozoicomonas sp.]
MNKQLFLFILLFLVMPARADFTFSTNNPIRLNYTWDPSDANPALTFPVNFTFDTCQGGNCNYWFALSDTNPGGTLVASFTATNVDQYISGVNFNQTPVSGDLTPGEWAEFSGNVNTVLTDNVTFTWDTQYFQSLTAGIYNLDFFLVGGDGSNFVQSGIEVIITIAVPDLVKVSGLEDAALNAADLISGQNLDSVQTICVFSNTGTLGLYFESSSNPGFDKPFKLSKAGQCQTGQTADCVPYRVRVSTANESAITLRSNGQERGIGWTSSDTLNCDLGENMTLRVRLKKDDIDNAQAGLYQDTLTVYVYPK